MLDVADGAADYSDCHHDVRRVLHDQVVSWGDSLDGVGLPPDKGIFSEYRGQYS